MKKKDPTLFDAVIYDSTVKGKADPHNINIALIYTRGSLKERLTKQQTLKQKTHTKQKLNIKKILWEELFDENFFGRSRLSLERISTYNEKPFAHKISFERYSLFTYNPRTKSHTEKVKFNHLLRGRKDPEHPPHPQSKTPRTRSYPSLPSSTHSNSKKSSKKKPHLLYKTQHPHPPLIPTTQKQLTNPPTRDPLTAAKTAQNATTARRSPRPPSKPTPDAPAPHPNR